MPLVVSLMCAAIILVAAIFLLRRCRRSRFHESATKSAGSSLEVADYSSNDVTAANRGAPPPRGAPQAVICEQVDDDEALDGAVFLALAPDAPTESKSAHNAERSSLVMQYDESIATLPLMHWSSLQLEEALSTGSVHSKLYGQTYSVHVGGRAAAVRTITPEAAALYPGDEL